MKNGTTILLFLALWGGALFAQSLTIYTEIAPPYQFLDAKGNLTGYAVELVQEIQLRVGNKDPIVIVPWVRGYQEALSKPNILLFVMDRSAQRDSLFQWVGPVSELSYMFYVKANSKIVIRNMEDAKKLTLIGVYKDDSRDQYLTKLGFKNLDRSLNQEVEIKKLMDGRIDALVDSSDGMADLVKLAGFSLQALRGAYEFQKVQTYLAFSKTTPDAIVENWKQALHAMRRDGSFKNIFRKYYPSVPLPGAPLKPY